jgi:hypothetical protein
MGFNSGLKELNATEYIPTNKNSLCDNPKLSNRKNPR